MRDDGLAVDLPSHAENAQTTAKLDISLPRIVQTLVTVAAFVVIDEEGDRALKIGRRAMGFGCDVAVA